MIPFDTRTDLSFTQQVLRTAGAFSTDEVMLAWLASHLQMAAELDIKVLEWESGSSTSICCSRCCVGGYGVS
jgi:hypothetical protein